MGLVQPTRAQLLTPPGKGGIAVISLAGPQTDALLQGLFRPWKSHAQTGPGVLQLGHLIGKDGQTLDQAVVQRQPDAAMINIHGGPLVTQAVLELLKRHGASIDPPGTHHAFDPCHPSWDNPAVGREMLDLLPRLHSPLALAAVTAQWSAGLSRLAFEAAGQLRLAGKDPGPPMNEIAARLRQAAGRLRVIRRLIEPAEVVLAGEPNSGKSTLANALSGSQMSIVHETPGTTRDWVRELVLLDGVPIWLTDTAGIWRVPAGTQTTDIDAQAVRRALDRLGRADVIVLLGVVSPDLREALDQLPRGKTVLRVRSKADLVPPPANVSGAAFFDVAISALTGLGMDELRSAIREALGVAHIDVQAPMAFTDRQKTLLLGSAEAIDNARVDDASQAVLHLLRLCAK